MHPDAEGKPRLLPGTGGIALGVHAGDLAAKWLADHLMPGASIEDAVAPPAQPGALEPSAPVADGLGGDLLPPRRKEPLV